MTSIGELMTIGPSPDKIDSLMLAGLAESPQLVALFDSFDILRWANRAFRSALHIGADEVLRWQDIVRRNHESRTGAVIQTRDFEYWLASALSRRGKLPYRSFETTFTDGRNVLMCETMTPQGWMVTIGTDVTHLNDSDRKLREDRDLALRAAQTDPLTGLSNRAHLLRLLDDLTGDPRCAPVCIAMIDLDHFKHVNDRFGHDAGDRVLCDCARILQGGVRRGDGCGRLGGEEFLILLPKTDIGVAEATIGRLQQLIRQSRPLADMPSWGYTCSIGLVQIRAQEPWQTAMSRADQAMYSAKAAGRDRLVTA